MTEQAFTRPDAPRFGIGTVLGWSFRVVGRGLVPFLAALLALGLLQCLGVIWLLEGAPPQFGPFGTWTSAGIVLSNTVADALMTGFMTALALCVLETGAADWRFALGRVPAAFPPLALLSLLYALIGRFGIPGLTNLVGFLAGLAVTLFVATFAWTYAAAAVRDGGSPLAALRRNLHLTSGRRAAILGLLVIFFVVAFVSGFVGRFLYGMAITSFGLPYSIRGVVGLQLGITFVINAFTYVAAAVGYHILSREKDGPVQAEVARVFD